MEDNKKKTFIGGAAILGFSGLLVKILGAVFRIPLTNIIGDTGIGYYQTAYPIYTTLVTISTTGIPVAVSRMIAERKVKGKYRECHKIYRCSMLLMAALGVFTGVLLFAFAPQISKLIKEPGAVWCFYTTAPALIVCPIIAAVRGFFQGQNNMIPTAASQFFEQVFRVIFGFALAIVLLPKGVEYAAAGAAGGAFIGAFIALLYLLIYLKNKMPGFKKKFEPIGTYNIPEAKTLLKEIAIIAIPITFGALIMPIVDSIDAVMVKARLLDIGFASETATKLYGQLSGMAKTIINMPSAITSAVCMSLVPVIADAKAKGETEFLRKNVNLSVRYASLVSMPCVLGILALAKPIMLLLYTDKEAAVSASVCLAVYSPGVALLAIHQAYSGVLQGIGKQKIPVRNLCIGAVIKIAVTYILCGIPGINVKGAAIGTVITYGIAALLNGIATKKYTGAKLNIGLCFIKPLIASVVMGVLTYGCYFLASKVFGNAISTLLSVAVGVVAYVVLILLIGAITTDELKSVKKLEKLAFLLDKVMGKRTI